jgi:hypothetical protein
MNIDKILSKDKQYDYLYHVEGALRSKGLTFLELKQYIRCGSSIHGVPSPVLTSKYGKDVKLPDTQMTCMCGHRIIEQCYLCPIGNQDLNQALSVGNHCIKKWGIKPAMRGKGLKVECDVCGAMLNKSGLARHHKTRKCQGIASLKHEADSSTISTTASDTSSISND